MKKNVQCIAKTINLAKPKTCARPSYVQKLVNADVISPCPNLIKNGCQTPCRPIPVKICTRIDMQRTLSPKVCECPQKGPPETVGKKLCRWVKNLIKTGIASGFVYWTTVEGFWGDGQEAEGLYHRIMATVSPAFEQVVEVEEINLPHIENMQHNILDAYNRLILRLVGLVVGVPILIEEKIQNFLFPCSHSEDEEKIAKKRG